MASIIKKSLFVKGLKLPEKKFSAKKPIEKISSPKKILILLQQHFGEPCLPLVSRGDKIKAGQIIANSEKTFSAPIHSSISGTVTNIIKIINPFANNIVEAIEVTKNTDEEQEDYIEFNKDEQLFEYSKKLENIYFKNFNNLYNLNNLGNIDKKDNIIIEKEIDSGDILNSKEIITKDQIKNFWQDLLKIINERVNTSKEDIIQKVKDAGIVGLGGATFPTHVKLSTKKPIDTIIINGCECEPYITSDHRIMLEYGWEVLAGAYIIFKVLSAKQVFIAIEDNKEDAVNVFSKLTDDANLAENFKVISLKSRYPMGAEKTLIKNVLGRKVPVGGLPMDVGVVVNNVGTAKSIFEAVSEGKPLIEKVITVTGDIKEPKNLVVKIGTPINFILSLFKELDEANHDNFKIILGGPMMGNVVNDLNFPITKAVNCILIKKAKPLTESNCIRCGRCVNICPMNLMPLMYVIYTKNNKFETLKEYNINTCIECGSCAYVCPASIPIVAYIKTGKSVLAGYK